MTVLIIGFSTALMLVISAVQLAYEYRNLRNNLKLELESVNIYVDSIASSVWNFDDKHIQLAVEGLHRLPNIEHVSVIASDTGKEWQAGKSPTKNNLTSHYDLLRADKIGQQSVIGRLTVVASIDSLNQQIVDRALSILISNGLKSFLVALFMLYLFRQLVTRRLEQLANKVQLLSATASSSLPAGQALSAKLDELDALGWMLDTSVSELKRISLESSRRQVQFQESQERIDLALDASNAGFWDWDLRTSFVYRSPRYFEIIGRRPEEDTHDFEFFKSSIHAEDLPFVLKSIEAHQQGKTPAIQAIYRLATGVGETRWLEANGKVVQRDENGTPLRIVGTLSDITERKRSDQLLHESEERYRTLVEMSPYAMVVQRGGTLIYVNTAAIRLFSAMSASDLVGKPVLDFIHPDFRKLALKRFGSIQQPGESVPFIQEKLLKLDGTVIDVEIQSLGITFNDKLAVQIQIFDLTERKRRESELAGLRIEMQTMMAWQVARHTVAALAHEVNQPLASLALLCEAASRMLANDSLAKDSTGEQPNRLQQTLQRMASETERADTVVRQLLKSAHQPDITLVPVTLGELLHEVVQIVHDESYFDCQIDIDCATNIKPVLANRLQLTKVLLNLISNSAQAMKNVHLVNGKIWIKAALAADGTEVCVSVRDEGPGISAKLKQEVFQPFITTKSDGLGMGLTISRALVEAHGGKLWLETHAGPGVTFHFTLPTSG